MLNIVPSAIISSYNKSTHELILKNGSIVRGISGDAYERLRGPQFHYAWVDEIGAFEYSQQSWDMMMFGLRLGKHPRVICTSTPKPLALLFYLQKRESTGDGKVVITQASTYANIANLAPTFQAQLLAYENTELGRQEIHAELLESYNSIFPLDNFFYFAQGQQYPEALYIINAIDTATSDRDYNDYSAGCTFLCYYDRGRVRTIVIDIWRGHYQYPELKAKIIEKSQMRFAFRSDTNEQISRGVDLTIVENASSGISVVQDLARSGLTIRGRKTGALNKIERAMLVSDCVANGYVGLVQTTSWDEDGQFEKKPHSRYYDIGWIDEICLYPNNPLEVGLTGEAAKRKVGFDDQLDAFVIGLSHLKKLGLLGQTQKPKTIRFADDDHLVINPYAQ